MGPICGNGSRHLFPEIGGLGSEIVLDVSAEVGEGREAEQVADFGKGACAVAQQSADVERGIARNPIVGRQSAHLFRHFAEIFGCDAEFVGVISYLAILSEIASFQQVDKLLHQLLVLCGNLIEAIQFSVEVEEVEYHRLHGIDEYVAEKVVLRLREALPDDGEVVDAAFLLFLREAHDGIVEQRQMPLHAIVALRCCHLKELQRGRYHVHVEVLAFPEMFYHVAPTGDNHTVALTEAEGLVVVGKRAISFMTIGMTQIVGEFCVTDVLERVVYDDMLYGIHLPNNANSPL